MGAGNKKKKLKFRINDLASYFIIFAGVFGLLHYFENFFKPIIVSLIIWYIIRELSRQLAKIKIRGWRLPYWLRSILSFLIIVAFGYSSIQIVIFNIESLLSNIPVYTQNINNLVLEVEALFNVSISERLRFENLDLRSFIGTAATGLTAFLSSSALILLYVIFLMAEERVINKKFRELSNHTKNKTKFFEIFGRINRAIHGYITVKFFTSFTTAILSYVVLLLLDVDLAGLWAFIIFIMNFIPNIGSILATIFPAFFALLQYSSFANFFIVGIAIGGIQLFVGNLLEPRIMGNRLNLSPFVILFSLFFWGYIWGILGMILSVPITVSLMIITASFPKTRPIAIILSQNGQLEVIEKMMEEVADPAESEESANASDSLESSSTMKKAG